MYEIVLGAHSVTRWLVLAVATAAIGAMLHGWLSKKRWRPAHARLNAALVGSLHLQLLLGVVLYATGISPTMKRALGDFGAAMKEPALRFWAVEHAAGMVVAVMIAHVAHLVSKNQEHDRARFQYAALGFMLAAALILALIPWPFRDLIGRALWP